MSILEAQSAEAAADWAAVPLFFFFMQHSMFNRRSRWVPMLDDEAMALLFPETGLPYRMISFGTCLTQADIEDVFFTRVTEAHGYGFRASDAVLIGYGGADGQPALLDGRVVETQMKALLDFAKLNHVPGSSARRALLERGIVPFDHPACAFPGVALPGVEDGTVLMRDDVWRIVSACTSTAMLSEWVAALRNAVMPPDA